MRLPIQYALTYPRRLPSPVKPLNFWEINSLTFEEPDVETFLGLKFAYEAGQEGGTLPCVFNAANEVAVNAFLSGRIKFLNIYDVIEQVMSLRPLIKNPTLEDLIAEDLEARRLAEEFIEEELT